MADMDTIGARDISEAEVLAKYKAAADVLNAVLPEVASWCVAGANVAEICAKSDALIAERTAATNKKLKDKGVGFPTCLSVNHVAGHFAPSEGDKTELADGDVVKIDMGAHYDGFFAQTAQTVVVGATADAPATGRKADVIAAAQVAGEVAHRLIKPGNTNTQVSEALNKVAEAFNCNLVEGVLSHQVLQYMMDGEKVIMARPTAEANVSEATFETNEVYVVDILMSTGSGKTREVDEKKRTVYRRQLDVNYALKLKASRQAFHKITTEANAAAFHVRMLGPRGSLAVSEMVRNDLLQVFPVLEEREGEFIAHVKFTLLLLPSQSQRATNALATHATSELAVEDAELKAVLATSTKKKRKNKKKKKKAAAAAETN